MVGASASCASARSLVVVDITRMLPDQPESLLGVPTGGSQGDAASRPTSADGPARSSRVTPMSAQKPASWAYSDGFVPETEVIESARLRGEALGCTPVMPRAGPAPSRQPSSEAWVVTARLLRGVLAHRVSHHVCAACGVGQNERDDQPGDPDHHEDDAYVGQVYPAGRPGDCELQDCSDCDQHQAGTDSHQALPFMGSWTPLG